jgi:hypothetical protein
MCGTRIVLPYCLDSCVCMFVLLLFSGTLSELRKASISLDMSFCLAAWNNSAPSGRIYEISYLSIFENLQVSLKSDKNY